MDVILRPVPAGHDVCLWDPAEFDDCSPVVPPPAGGGGGGFLPWNLRWEGEKPDEDDDLEIVQILTYWLNRL